ncbi:MAG: 30S ribosomal protein S15 [Nanoarchaeota archaeon]
MKKSESKKPVWLKFTKEEIKAIILKLSNKGINAEKIGLILRDQYGIPNVKLYNLKIKEVMGDKFSEPSIINLEKKFEKIIKHFEKNKQDTTAGRALIVTRSKLKKRTTYHKSF